MHEVLQQLGPFVEELSAARRDRWRGVIGHGARETLVCDFEVEGGILDLSLSDPEEAARANLYIQQAWRITLAVDERAQFEERTQGRSTGPPVSGSPQGAEE